MRPFIPSLVLQSNASPTGFLGAGAYGTGSNSLNSWNGRSDWDAEVVWQFKNLGFGNRGLVTQRRGEHRQALVELFRVQDMVAAEVAQAHAQVEGRRGRVVRAEAGLKAAVASYEGNLKGLSQTVRAGELLQLVNRPQEVVAALQQLQQAYMTYYTSANDYNRAQFRLFRAVGYAAQSLACADSLGPVIPVDSCRPPQMAPVQRRLRAAIARADSPSVSKTARPIQSMSSSCASGMGPAKPRASLPPNRCVVTARPLLTPRLARNLPVGLHQRPIDEVLGDEPYLHLVGANHAADQEVIGAVVSFLASLPGHRTRFLEQNLMRVQQARDLHGRLFTSRGRLSGQRRRR